MSRIAIVGGGVSGLVAAYLLRRALGPDAQLTIIEQSDRLGGKLRTIDLAGTPVDVGAEAFVLRNPAAADLVAELGLGERLVHPVRSAATVHAGGATVPLPKRTFLGVPAGAEEVRGVLSAGGAARVAEEITLPPLALPDAEDVAVGEVLAARFGRELVDHLVEPLLGGVYAGRADRLGLRATMPALVAALPAAGGSLTAAASRLLGKPSGTPRPVFGAVRGGMGVLVDELARQSGAEIRLGTTVRGLACDEGPLRHTERAEGALHRMWRVEAGGETLHVDAVVLAVPPPAARRLLADVAPAASAAYARIEVGSMAVLSMVLPDGATLPDSSGVLIAVGERHRDGTPLTAKAFTYTSVKWGGAGVRLRASVGRVGEEQTLRRDDDALLADVLADLAELTGVRVRPVDATVTRWGGGLPQYGVTHTAAVAEIERAVAGLPGLAVAGAAFQGVGIPACVDTASAAADRIVTHLAGRMDAWPA